ncbi:MAG: DUF1566 domain-containing protein [Magnetococcales bacterium]|nr:DUF1566 domain-containing protein [Magnetococcales bacterium]
MTTSGDPIIELRGHLVHDTFHRFNVFEQSFLQRMSNREGFFTAIQVRLFMLFALLVRCCLFLYHYATMVRPVFGIKSEVTLRFYKDHIDLSLVPFFWFVAGSQEQHRISWHNTAIHGKRHSVLLFFTRCHLFVTPDQAKSWITDLGPMPKEAFQKLVERLKAFASSPTIRQQIATSPYRFRAKGLLLLAAVMAGILLTISTGTLAYLYGPQLLQWARSLFQDHTDEQAKKADEPPPATETKETDPKLNGLEGYTFLTDLEAKYRQQLRENPDNWEAKQGLALLAEQYVGLARKAGDDRAWDKAEAFLVRAEQIDPSLDSIETTRKKIRRDYELFHNALPDKTPAATSAPAQKSATEPKKPHEEEKKYGWLVDNRDGTITDTHTGLIGMKGACLEKASWEESMAAVARLEDDQCGLSDDSVKGDWRLPTKEELPNLFEWEKSGLFAVGKGRTYWSSTPHPGDASTAWFVDPKNRYVDFDHKTNGHHVWPVRRAAR